MARRLSIDLGYEHHEVAQHYVNLPMRFVNRERIPLAHDWPTDRLADALR
jgi:hypothetical protein